MRVIYIGHATVLIELDGVRLLTDPVLRGHLMHLRRQVSPTERSLLGDLDVLLISHAHMDHLDRRSLTMFDRALPVLAPRGAAEIVRKLGFEDVREVAVGDSLAIGAVTITATRADHVVRRHRWGATSDAVGFSIDGTATAYFAGDTGLFDDLSALRTANGDRVDLALLPVWGWGPSIGAGHLNPEQAARAAQLIQPKVAVPIHWGTLFPLGLAGRLHHLLVDPPRAFAREVEALNLSTRVEVLEPGTALDLSVDGV